MTDRKTGREVVPGQPLQEYLALEAVKDTFSGKLTEEEARRLRRRTITLTEEEVMAVDAIVQHPLTDYTFFSEFVRSAVVQLAMAYVASGFPERSVSETVKALQESRRHSARLALRGQFQQNFSQSEVALLDWTTNGDWEAIDKELTYLDGIVKSTHELSSAWAFRMESIIVRSAAVKGAIMAMKEHWTRKKGQRETGARWVEWLEALS